MMKTTRKLFGRGNAGSRGYMFSALTTLMFLSLFVATYYFYGKALATTRADITADKTAGFFDDVQGDVTTLIDLRTDIDDGNPVAVTFNDRIPAAWDIPSSIRNYSNFLSTTYSNEVSSRLSLNASALSSANTTVNFTIYPYRYAYGYPNLSKTEVWLVNESLDYQPQGLRLGFDFTNEGINDLIWLEAEDFQPGYVVNTYNSQASMQHYFEDFDYMNKTVEVPVNMNYTLWVRTIWDESVKNFTVSIDGKNSTQFNIRHPNSAPTFKWFNDTQVTFNLTAGFRNITVYPSPASGTESIDVILLTTRYVALPDSVPIVRPKDQIEVANASGGGWTFNMTMMFANVNYTFGTGDLARDATSQWNITFNDDDSVRILVGNVTLGYPRTSGLMVDINDTVNGSFGTVNTTIRFPYLGGETYVDSDCTLNVTSQLDRFDTLWLARG
jgi:hypothetical protein